MLIAHLFFFFYDPCLPLENCGVVTASYGPTFDFSKNKSEFLESKVNRSVMQPGLKLIFQFVDFRRLFLIFY
jgi:hypothetical protein